MKSMKSRGISSFWSKMLEKLHPFPDIFPRFSTISQNFDPILVRIASPASPLQKRSIAFFENSAIPRRKTGGKVEESKLHEDFPENHGHFGGFSREKSSEIWENPTKSSEIWENPAKKC